MHRIIIENTEALASIIENQLDSSPEFRMFKKLYTLLLVARSPYNNCSEAARQLGYSPPTVARWIRRISVKGGFDLERLKDKDKPGRSRRLNKNQLNIIKDVIKDPPKTPYGMKKWTGVLLSQYLKQEFGVDLQIRQCQKLMATLRSKKKTSSKT